MAPQVGQLHVTVVRGRNSRERRGRRGGRGQPISRLPQVVGGVCRLGVDLYELLVGCVGGVGIVGEGGGGIRRVHLPGGGGGSPGGGRGILLGPWGAVIFHEPGAPAWGGTGSPAQGVAEASLEAYGGPSSCKNRAHRPGGGWGVQPRGWPRLPWRPTGGHHPT